MVQGKNGAFERELFERVLEDARVTGDPRGDRTFLREVNLAQDVMTLITGHEETSLFRADGISELAERPVYLKMENETNGGGAKARAVFGIVLHYVTEHLHTHTDEHGKPDTASYIADLKESANPVRQLLKDTFESRDGRQSVVVANSAGNHAISVADVFDILNREVGTDVKVEVLVPTNAPPGKLVRIKLNGGEVIGKYGSSNRETLLDSRVDELRKAGRTVFIAPTEPRAGSVDGGYAGLGTIGLELTHTGFHGKFEVRDPMSSGPTLGSLAQVFRLTGQDADIHAVQDHRNGGLVKLLLERDDQHQHTLLDTEERTHLEKLDKRIDRSGNSGKAENGMSTPHINGITQAEIFDQDGKPRIDPLAVHLVHEPEMKLAAFLVYADTKTGRDSPGAVWAERAGASAVASVLQEVIEEQGVEKFAERAAAMLTRKGITRAEFEKYSDMSDKERAAQDPEGLFASIASQLPEQAQKVDTRQITVASAPSEKSPVIAVMSGANRRQPLEIGVRRLARSLIARSEEHYYDPNETHAALKELLVVLKEAHPLTVRDTIGRQKTVTIGLVDTDDSLGRDVFHAGDEIINAIHSAAILLENEKKIEAVEKGEIVELVGKLKHLNQQYRHLGRDELTHAVEDIRESISKGEGHVR